MKPKEFYVKMHRYTGNTAYTALDASLTEPPKNWDTYTHVIDKTAFDSAIEALKKTKECLEMNEDRDEVAIEILTAALSKAGT